MKIKVVNHRQLIQSGLDLNFAITAKSEPINLSITSPIESGITYNTSYKVSDFVGQGNSFEISCDNINSARLYVGYDTFPTSVSGSTAPIPDGQQYYGWIEFSYWTGDTNVWINLSNVDITALPLTLSASSWHVGLKNSAKSIIDTLAKSYPGSVIKTPIYNKILSPSSNSKPFPSFDPYFNYLSNANSKLCIYSDTMSDGTQKQFTGGFNSKSKSINLTSNSGDTFVIPYSAFTSDIIYRGDSEKIVFYNNEPINENRTGSTDSVISSNSVFRNIVIGLNEGYFEANPSYSNGINYSINFAYFEPFRYLKEVGANVGNMYAKVIHDNSNSYGFAYADSNLKVLIQSNPDEEITMNIINDDATMDYDNHAASSENHPNNGPVQFAFGQGSQALGEIRVGNCVYPASTTAAGCGSFLPYVDEWIKMEFMGTITAENPNPNYIWINPMKLEVAQIGNLQGGGTGYCLSNGVSLVINDVTVPKGKKLTWGADNSWVSGVSNPVKPAGSKPVQTGFCGYFKYFIDLFKKSFKG